MPQYFKENCFKEKLMGWLVIPFVVIPGIFIISSQAQQAIAQPGLAPSHAAPSALPNSSEPDDGYILGAGDQIRIDVFDVPEVSGTTYTILADGSLTLPWIGKISLKGLTIDQAVSSLTQRYARFVRDPLITVTLTIPRPIRIGIVGEVNRPGAYVTGQTAGGTITTDTATNSSNAPIRTVTQAIQTAGGITQMADVRGIEVQRFRPNNQKEVLKVDLWQFLNNGDLSQDLALRDGDTVVVPTVGTINYAEATRLASANFSPATIKVNIVGEVKTPGALSLQSNVSLNQALLAAGGFDNKRASTDKVQLIRINPDGTAVRRDLEIDFTAGVNEATNPPLRNNDIIIVGRSDLASTTDFLSTLLSPLNPLLNLFGIIQLFGGR